MALDDSLRNAARQASTADRVEHRPWPLPDRPWASARSWVDRAFLHWRVDPGLLRPFVPAPLELETYGDTAYLGITPSLLVNLRPRGLLPLPGLSTCLEVHVRTYVTDGERPGIWFLALDADSMVLVEAAKRLYKLPYERAQMSCERSDGLVHFESVRPGAAFGGRYRGVGEPFEAAAGSLEEFLVERYCLYTADGGRVFRAEVHHLPWQLRRGEAAIGLNTLAPVALPDDEPLVLFAERQDALVWPLEELPG
jgi:uncharacterized protein